MPEFQPKARPFFVWTPAARDGSDEVVTVHPHVCTSGEQPYRNHHCHHKAFSDLSSAEGALTRIAPAEFLLRFIHTYTPDHRDGLCCLYLLLTLLSPWKSQRQPSHPPRSPPVGCQKRQRRQNCSCLLWGTDESEFVLGGR